MWCHVMFDEMFTLTLPCVKWCVVPLVGPPRRTLKYYPLVLPSLPPQLLLVSGWVAAVTQSVSTCASFVMKEAADQSVSHFFLWVWMCSVQLPSVTTVFSSFLFFLFLDSSLQCLEVFEMCGELCVWVCGWVWTNTLHTHTHTLTAHTQQGTLHCEGS